jgi:CsoR family transcriptional regulator, copper-sensing transcriptional repressor
MLATARLDDATRTGLIARLRSIEGQAHGVQKMLADGRDCQEILDQLAALRAATHAVSMRALEAFIISCFKESDEPRETLIAQFMGVVSKLAR